MKKIMLAIGIMLSLAMLFSHAYAVGPYVAELHKVAWDANTETDLAGYYVYYRPVTTPSTAWDNSRRSGTVVVSPTPKYDLLQLITINGSYEVMVTAFDTSANESGPSNIVPFVLDLPAAPKNARKE